MTYNVFSGTLNPTHFTSLYKSIGFTKVRHYMWTERPSLWRLVVIMLQGYQCQHCSCAFCVDCDLFVHETMHSCPGCASSRQTNSWFFAFAWLPSHELSATAHRVAWQNRQCVVGVGFLNIVNSANHLWVNVAEKKSCMLQILPSSVCLWFTVPCTLFPANLIVVCRLACFRCYRLVHS